MVNYNMKVSGGKTNPMGGAFNILMINKEKKLFGINIRANFIKDRCMGEEKFTLKIIQHMKDNFKIVKFKEKVGKLNQTVMLFKEIGVLYLLQIL